eukprot:jgi/Botrbrau1/3318/Bobra.0048s0014.1
MPKLLRRTKPLSVGAKAHIAMERRSVTCKSRGKRIVKGLQTRTLRKKHKPTKSRAQIKQLSAKVDALLQITAACRAELFDVTKAMEQVGALLDKARELANATATM